jgi:hypothetical protein
LADELANERSGGRRGVGTLITHAARHLTAHDCRRLPVPRRSFLVGEVDEAGKQLVKVTHDCWQAAIDYCRPGQPFSGIGASLLCC